MIVNSENLNRRKKINLSKAARVARTVLKSLGMDDAEVNLTFFTSQRIRVLNRVYLGKDEATDVIAFPGGEARGARRKARKGFFLGDIAISTDRAGKNARLYRTGLTEEVMLYVIHGLLHLAGYDDTTKKERAAMRKKEREFLEKIRSFL
jgi:probable rRNA maturation factor